MTPPVWLAVALCAAISLSACATDRPSPSEDRAALLEDIRVGDPVERICFAGGIDSFTHQTDRSVVLRRGVRDTYLVTVQSCPDLDIARGLSLGKTSGCLRRFDRLHLSPDANVRAGFNACIVEEIYRWDEGADDASQEAETPDGQN